MAAAEEAAAAAAARGGGSTKWVGWPQAGSSILKVHVPSYLLTGVSFEGKLSARGAPWWSDARQDAGSQGAEALPTCTSTSPEQHMPGCRACTCPEQLMCPRRKLPSQAFTDSVLRHALLLAAGAPDHYELGT